MTNLGEKNQGTNNFYIKPIILDPIINQALHELNLSYNQFFKILIKSNIIMQMCKRWQCHSIWVRGGAESNENVIITPSSTPHLWPIRQQSWWNSRHARDTLWFLQPQEITREWFSSSVLPGTLHCFNNTILMIYPI